MVRQDLRGRNMRFVHTADWQIGKPFARILDPRKRALVQQARVDVIKQIGTAARDGGAAFVLVGGDLFDSSSADKATVSAACSAIGQIGVPVFAIPGNHDHGGPGSFWDQEFFRREQGALAPNMTVLLEATPFECESAVILPCPPLRRTAIGDPTAWLRSAHVYAGLPAGKPRVVLAHGSTQVFSGGWDDEGEGDSVADLIDLGRIPEGEIDFVALGDWHGTKQVGPKAWYSGTPEPDRFPKGEDHDAGNILVVDAERGGVPSVGKVRTGKLVWAELSFDLADDLALSALESQLISLLGRRTGEDLLHLSLSGSLGIEASNRLGQMLESLEARLLRLKLADRTLVAPTDEEIQALTEGGGNPLIARVARELVDRAAGQGEVAAVARVALRELHAVWAQEKRG
jgi:DNA repair exonuclease SbcCD nuclease subunit